MRDSVRDGRIHKCHKIMFCLCMVGSGAEVHAAFPGELPTTSGSSNFQYGTGDGVFVIDLSTLPAAIFPGQRAMNGTQIPPSKSAAL